MGDMNSDSSLSVFLGRWGNGTSSSGFEPDLLALSGSQKQGVVELHYMLWTTIVKNTLGSLWIVEIFKEMQAVSQCLCTPISLHAALPALPLL